MGYALRIYFVRDWHHGHSREDRVGNEKSGQKYAEHEKYPEYACTQDSKATQEQTRRRLAELEVKLEYHCILGCTSLQLKGKLGEHA
jgi:hypothetical protein